MISPRRETHPGWLLMSYVTGFGWIGFRSTKSLHPSRCCPRLMCYPRPIRSLHPTPSPDRSEKQSEIKFKAPYYEKIRGFLFSQAIHGLFVWGYFQLDEEAVVLLGYAFGLKRSALIAGVTFPLEFFRIAWHPIGARGRHTASILTMAEPQCIRRRVVFKGAANHKRRDCFHLPVITNSINRHRFVKPHRPGEGDFAG